MNLLITSAGRRGYIVEYFKKVIGNEGKVYVGNSSPFSAAFSFTDECIVTPLIYDDTYILFLTDFCQENRIDFLLSLFDIDLLILAHNKWKFEEVGTKVIVSSPQVIERCNDKWKAYLFCKEGGINTAETYININDVLPAIKAGKLEFPLMVKPRWGMGSMSVFEADNIKELEVLYEKCKRDIGNSYLKYESVLDKEQCVIIQQKSAGSEYGIDVINDLNGNYCSNVVRKKYAMRAGETDCAAVVQNENISSFAQKLGGISGHIANLDVDVFIDGKEVYLLEMNAGFGGAVCFEDEKFGLNSYRLKNFGIRGSEIVDGVGANAKMNEFCAAMGLCNLRHVKGEIEKRKKVAERYRSHLDGIDGIWLNPV